MSRDSMPMQNSSVSSASDLARDGIYLDVDTIAQLVAIAASLLTVSASCGWLVGNRQKWRDTIAIAAVVSVVKWKAIWAVVAQVIPSKSYIYTFVVISLQAVVASQRMRPSRQNEDVARNSHDKHFLQPLVFPCRTTHTRLFPTKHSFAYSYLFVGIPVGWNHVSGSLLSTERSRHSTWYSVHSDDYLARGADAGGLQSKLNAYLAAQNVPADRYPFVYLVTAPRFLGFSFNPVSFWYLYDKNRVLAAMVLEVNNTFDERRMYFMENEPQTSDADRNFSNEWTKDFHVSPFNDRDGSYSLQAKDPITASGNICIDNTITLKSDDGKAKVVARVFSTEAGVDPMELSSLQTWLFVARWWWVGFMTNPRILREARMLWVKKLQVFYRPEVMVTSIGRNESAEEARLEPYFRTYLQQLVDLSVEKISLRYSPAAGEDRGKLIQIMSTGGDRVDTTSLELKVLTPAFYAEVAKASSASEAFDTYCFAAVKGASMAAVSDVHSMRKLLQSAEGSREKTSRVSPLKRPYLVLRQGRLLKAIQKMLVAAIKTQDVQDLRSDFDILSHVDQPEHRHEYSHVVTKLLLADITALGFMPLFGLYAAILWSLVGCLLVRSTLRLFEQWSSPVEIIKFVTAALVLHCSRGLWIGPSSRAKGTIKNWNLESQR